MGQLETQMSNRELVEWLHVYRIEREREQEAAMDAKLEARHRGRG